MMASERNWQWAATVGAFCFATTAVVAGPLLPQRVARDAKWVLHLDGEAFLKTEVGKHIADTIFERELGKLNKGLKKDFDSEIAWRKTTSLTIYGTEFKANGVPNGVVIVEGDVGITDTLDKVWQKEQDQSFALAADLQVVEETGGRLYIWKKEQYGTSLGKNLFALARSKEELAHAKAVFAGKEPSLGKPGSKLATTLEPVLEVRTPQGLEGAEFSREVAILKRCNDGRLVMAEKDNDVQLDLHLTTNDKNVATQIRQVLQGIISLGLLSGEGDQDLKKLATSASVGGDASEISLKLHMPSEDLIKKIGTGKQQAKK